jgi:hypothetical protein
MERADTVERVAKPWGRDFQAGRHPGWTLLARGVEKKGHFIRKC